MIINKDKDFGKSGPLYFQSDLVLIGYLPVYKLKDVVKDIERPLLAAYHRPQRISALS